MLGIPGKTFLVGEYAVLVGGEALLLATAPVFTLTNTDEAAEPIKYHPHSAVGLFNKTHHFEFNQKISNPYQAGGFGQSTAEFIFAWFEKQHQNSHKKNSIEHNNYQSVESSRIYEDYLDLYDSTPELQKLRPSGADLMAMLLGQVSHVTSPVVNSKSMAWPFPQLSFFIVSTGLKIQTHEHLNRLNRSTLVGLPELSSNAIRSFYAKDEKGFLSSLRNYSAALEQLKLQHTEVLGFSDNISKNKNILLVKPCGAMGADVCLVFCANEKKSEVRSFLMSEKINIQADELHLSHGVIEKIQALKTYVKAAL